MRVTLAHHGQLFGPPDKWYSSDVLLEALALRVPGWAPSSTEIMLPSARRECIRSRLKDMNVEGNIRTLEWNTTGCVSPVPRNP